MKIEPSTLADQLLYATCRIEATGRPDGGRVGTAFWYRHRHGDKFAHFLVTNWHVVEGSESTKTTVHLKDASDSSVVNGCGSVLPLPGQTEWFQHPDGQDIGVLALAHTLNNDVFIRYLSEDVVRDPDFLARAYTAVEDVVMVGYPNGLWDTKNNYPIVRRGTTASHPAVSFKGTPQGVLDIAVFPGSSGSPVFIMRRSDALDAGAGIAVGVPKGREQRPEVTWLGILWGGPVEDGDGTIAAVPIAELGATSNRNSQRLHLGYYIKAQEVVRTCAHAVEHIEQKIQWTIGQQRLREKQGKV